MPSTPAAPRRELFEFAFFPKYEADIQNLAENLADREDWDFISRTPTTLVKRYPILKTYLEHTFRRLQAEKKVVFTLDNKHASFNTGLVTPNLEDIVAFFEQNRSPAPGHITPYVFKGFYKRSDYRILTYFSTNPPDVADYFDRPELLLFNPKSTIIPDIDHIIGDNLQRFPAHLRTASDAELRRQLFGAIEETSKKVRTNYKTAIPQHFAGKIQLLLPLCLTAGSPNPDLALVVYKINDNMYAAKTCLTLEMAYNNARLIVKPQSEWLKP